MASVLPIAVRRAPSDQDQAPPGLTQLLERTESSQSYLFLSYGIVAVILIGSGLGVLISLDKSPSIGNEYTNNNDAVPFSHSTTNATTNITSTCDISFDFPKLSNIYFIDSEQLQEDCLLRDIAPFMDFLLAGLRIECISGNMLLLLALSAVAQLGGIPSVMNGNKYSPLGSTLWLIWMGFSTFQFITNFLAQLMTVLAAFSFVGQYQDELTTLKDGLGVGLGAMIGLGVALVLYLCLLKLIWRSTFDEESSLPCLCSIVCFFVPCGILCTGLGVFYGSFTRAPLFNTIIPSLLFHPSFVTKNAALSVYAFTIFQGVSAAGFNINVDHLMRLSAWVMVAPLLATGIVYFVLTASFIFSITFFVPMSVCLVCVFVASWRILQLSKKYSIVLGETKIQQLISNATNMNPWMALEGSLWWVSDTPLSFDMVKNFRRSNLRGSSTMLLVVLFSSVLLVLSPLLTFGQWAAFYAYVGNSPLENMNHIEFAYAHFFGVFIDFKFYVPDIFNYKFDDISKWANVLKSIPSFDDYPPGAMLTGSAVFSALTLLLALMKPVVCVISSIFHMIGVVEKNKKVGEVAEKMADLRGILKGLRGEARDMALKLRHIQCVAIGDTITEIGVVKDIRNSERYVIAFDLISISTFISSLVKIDFDNCEHVAGDISVFENTPAIEYIHLRSTNCYGDVKIFESIPAVKEVDLRNTHCSGDIQVLENVDSATRVNLENTKCTGILTAEIINIISFPKDAVKLRNCGRLVIAEDLMNIADISHLNLSGFPLLEGRINLSYFSELKSIDISGTKIDCSDILDLLTSMPWASQLEMLNLSKTNAQGCLTGECVRLISDIRLKHDRMAVQLFSCGRFLLADDLTNIADITYVDLSFIKSLEGTFTGEIIRLISNIRLKHGQSAVTFEGCGRLSLTHEFSNIADIIHIDLSDIKSLEGSFDNSFQALTALERFDISGTQIDCSHVLEILPSMPWASQLEYLNLSGTNTEGTFTGVCIRLISGIRLKHGQKAVNLERCGRFVLADDLMDIADLTHVDLSGIKSLEGDTSVFLTCTSLTYLYISECDGLHGGLGAIEQALPNCYLDS